jgi:hypothetical protein
MKTNELSRDDQITLIALFPQGNNECDFHTKSRITKRQKDSLDSLVKKGFITERPLGRNGLRYNAVKKHCGRPMSDLPLPEEHECFDIVGAL